MPLGPGVHRFGPENATLTVRTRRTGAASKAGHDLLIEVTSWSAALELGDDATGGSLTLSADARSLRVLEGTGGIQALDADAKAGIEQTIHEEVLEGTSIEFRSTSVEGGEPIRVQGELELCGERRAIAFELASGEDGALTGTVLVKQTEWGMKPYTTLFGTLKVADEVEVAVEARPEPR